MSDIKELALKYQDYMVCMRRRFHQYPEISGKEFQTRDLLIHEIESMQVPYKMLKGTGIIAVIEGFWRKREI